MQRTSMHSHYKADLRFKSPDNKIDGGYLGRVVEDDRVANESDWF